MNIEPIKTTLSSLPQNAYKTVNSVGSTTIEGARQAGVFISKHAPQALKNFKTPEKLGTFVSSAKEKAPEFLKKSAKFVSEHKDTFAGGAVILGALACAYAIVKTIADKVKQAKAETLMSMHQG